VAIIGIIAAIAVPGLLRARQSGNEASAIGSLRAINSAQASYASSCGSGFYAPNLTVLGTPPTGVAGATAFISPDLGSANTVIKSGYTIVAGSTSAAITNPPVSCNGGTVVQGYNATAAPLAGGGSRSFGTNTTSTIWQQTGTTAPTMDDVATPASPAMAIQ
jgi:type IV pilus assembly protein PilA